MEKQRGTNNDKKVESFEVQKKMNKFLNSHEITNLMMDRTKQNFVGLVVQLIFKFYGNFGKFSVKSGRCGDWVER